MIKKALFVVGLACLLALLLALPVGAYYSSVTGELRDSVTDSPWTHGATVAVYECDSEGTTGSQIASQAVDSTGTVNIGLSSTSPWLCVVVDFTAGGAGKPVNQERGPIANDLNQTPSTLDLGVIYTNTGPAAVSLQQLSASAAAGSPALIAFGLMLLGAVSVVMVRRS